MSEKTWVEGLSRLLEQGCQHCSGATATVRVASHQRLAYGHETQSYGVGSPETETSVYETDLLVTDHQTDNNSWTPRVVIEGKLGSVTTHDALTYSAKAATHKNVHPYLRYGLLIGSWGDSPLPARVFRHGVHFDFIAVWSGEDPTTREWEVLTQIVTTEIKVSRQIQEFLRDSRRKHRARYSVVHREMRFFDSP
ncbi:MAG: hypothetical protein DHS20C21_09210 [Gemmatimonadota bacterium]|nr:MAG: hypothetical protein DHS20C21_09210 [Gemmatimonadota bacterium]